MNLVKFVIIFHREIDRLTRHLRQTTVLGEMITYRISVKVFIGVEVHLNEFGARIFSWRWCDKNFNFELT